jgi:tRNA(fMet)-specific endonuclease VapC
LIYALDITTLGCFFRGEGGVASRLLATPPREIAVPSVVVFELEVGIARSNQPKKRRGQLDALLALVTVLPFDHAAARCAAELDASLSAAGTPMGPMDMMIAGSALARHAMLVTHNVREFRRVKGLRIEDWY